MSQIRISPDAMRGRASEYAGHKGTLDELTMTLNALLATLQEEWEGQATVSFASQWEGIKPSFDNCSQLLADISTQLSNTAEAMESLDAQISGQMGI